MGMAYGIGGVIKVPAASVTGQGPPPASFRGGLGQIYLDVSVDPSEVYIYDGNEWVLQQGGTELATTTNPGIVELATLAELQGGTAPGNQVPTANDVATVIAGVVVGAVPPATTAQQGIVELASAVEVVSPWTPTIPNTVVSVGEIETMFASPPPIGVTAQETGDFTDVTASGTLGVTGVTTLAGMTATNAAFSGTLGVTGTSTLDAVNATNITASGTLGVTGTSTLAAVNATNGTFSGTLAVTGATTTGAISATNILASGTLGVSGASSFSSGTFSTTLGVTGTTTLGGLTQVGTANINASGAGVTTIGTGGTGATNIGNATGNTAVTGSLTTTTTLVGGTGISATTGDITATDGNLVLSGAGSQIQIESGAATDFVGTATLVAGTLTIANTNIAATDLIFLSRQSINGSTALGSLTYSISAATSFTITSVDPGTPANTETNDVSIVKYFIVRGI